MAGTLGGDGETESLLIARKTQVPQLTHGDDFKCRSHPRNMDVGTKFTFSCTGVCSSVGMNNKWLVICDSVKGKLKVINLQLEDQQPEPGGAPLLQQQTVIDIPGYHYALVYDVSMDQTREDEALLRGRDLFDAPVVFMVLVPLAQLWSQDGSVSTISCTSINLPSSSYKKLLVLHTESNGRAFIILSSLCETSFIVQHFTENNCASPVHSHTYNNIKGDVSLSQMSERLYCVSYCNKIELWDCNSPFSALRVVDSHVNCCPLVIAHSGFLFHHQNNNEKILVTDNETGAKLLHLHFGGGGPQFMLGTHFSFLL
ncbi:hypothetical protein Pelo_1786 [Pelomyxa schiedti]|nr:hypothetical protein Pelo_1786 [Pelomyxa schiedti]